MTGKLMEINLEGNLVVSYSDRFATFLREVSLSLPCRVCFHVLLSSHPL